MMRKIVHIARNELYALFYSPIAWLLMILFIIVTGGRYADVMGMFMKISQKGGRQLSMMENLTSQVTSNPMMGYLHNVLSDLYIFFPLITMGLISREKNAETIKLLYSSPVRIREIVLGKYLGVLVFTFFLMLLLSLTLVGLSLSIIHPDYTLLLTSVFGIFLVLSTYAAIGLFISSLTSYQVVAAIITLAIFIVLKQIGGYWQDIDFVRYVSYYMDITQKSKDLVFGWFNLRDLTYFLVIISGFLTFTMIKIKSGTESISVWRKTTRYVMVIIVAFIIGYVTDRPEVNMYYDATRNDLYTIALPTQRTIAKLNDGKLEITAYANLLHDGIGQFGPKSLTRVEKSVFEPYIRFKPDIDINIVYYYNMDSTNYRYQMYAGKSLKQIAEQYAKIEKISFAKFLSPEQVSKFVDVNAEDNRCFFVVKYKGRQTILRTFDDPEFFPSENEVAAALNRLIMPPPMIAFISDEIERSPFSNRERDYRSLASQLGYRYSLVNQGYDFDTLSLKTQSIPANLAALVIADPRTPISLENQSKINDYIDKGGNLLLLSEPDRADIIKPVMDKLGLSLRQGMLIQPSDEFSSDMALTNLTDVAQAISPQLQRKLKNERRYWGDSLSRIGVKGASAINYKDVKDFAVFPLMLTDEQRSWNRTRPISQDSLQLKVAKTAGDERGSFVAGLQMRRNINGKEQRILVISDADCLNAQLFRRMIEPRAYNEDFAFWSFGYFSYGLFPANTLLEESTDNAFRISPENIDWQRRFFYYVIPAILAITCSVLLIRRKRK